MGDNNRFYSNSINDIHDDDDDDDDEDNNNVTVNDDNRLVESETMENSDDFMDNYDANNEDVFAQNKNNENQELQQISDNPNNLESKCTCGSEICKSINITEELDKVLKLDVVFKNQNYFDKIWPLLTNRKLDIQSYLNLLNEYRIEHHCGAAWAPNYVAYRCRTCSNLLTMAICPDCFRDGNHEGHDYNMFKSRSGGACDCGYSFVEKMGHCKRHGENALAKRANEKIPNDLICIPRRIMPRLLHRLAIFLRTSIDITSEIELYLDFLNKLINSSAIMRSLMIDALLSDKAYSSQIQLFSTHSDKKVYNILEDGLKSLKREMKNSIPFKIPENWGFPSKVINKNRDKSNCINFLDEFLFWIINYDFSQKLVCFFMSFLMDNNYKKVFSRLFVQYYPRMLMVMIAANVDSGSMRQSRESYELLTRRMLQVSVQIYMDKNVTRKLCEKEYALHSLIYCLKVAIEGLPSFNIKSTLKKNPLCMNNLKPESKRANVVSCDNIIIRERNLVSFIEDLNEILDVDTEVERLILDKDLCDIWLEMLLNFQTICFYKRELIQHAPYETGLHISPFTIESDFCMNPLWTILNILKPKTPEKTSLVKSLVQCIHANLSNWIHLMGLNVNSVLNPYILNFHIPVHRMFGATLRHLLFVHKLSDQEVYKLLYYSQVRNRTNMTIVEFLKVLLIHPIQALTLYHEVRNNMWTRNGLLTINQAATYVHGAYCNCTIDIDMFLLRYNAAKLSPNYLLKTLMSKFNMWKWLSYKTNDLLVNDASSRNSLHDFMISPEQSLLMLESALIVVIQMLTLGIHCNISEKEQIRQELVAIISVSDRPYSYLYNMLPDRLNNSKLNFDDKDFSELLTELALYKPAQHGNNGQLQQGYYSLKNDAWDNEYDPIFVQYRFYQKRDYQASLERFFNQARSKGVLENRYHSSALFPPLKVPQNQIANFGNLDLSQILECQTLVGIIFSIIYKDLYVVELPDVVISYAIYLLELSLRKYLEKKTVDKDDKNKLNPLFTGKYFYGKLFSTFDSFTKNATRGNLIQASIMEESDQQKSENFEDSKIYLIVKDALDLNFETTWFPFTSIVDNLTVYIDNVHSMRSKEFELRLKEVDFDDDELSKNLEPETSSSEFMCWSNDDDADEEDDNSDSDDVGDEEDLDDDDDDDDDDFDLLNTDEETHDDSNDTMPVRNARVIEDTTDSDSEITVLIRQRSMGNNRSENLTSTSNQSGRASLVVGDNTELNSQASVGQNSSIVSNQQDLNFSLPAQRTLNSATSASNDCISSDQQRIESTIENETEPNNVETISLIDDVEMISVNFNDNNDTSNQTRQSQIARNLTGQSNNSLNLDNNAVSHPQTEITSSNSNETISDRQPSHTSRVINDHNYSHNYVETSMEVDSLPEIHSTALSLIPINHPFVRDNNDQSTQIYPENLVTERRAILASDPRPMITSGIDQQPLALQATPATTSNIDRFGMRNLRERRQQHQNLSDNTATTSSDTSSRSLSDFDIQARFTGFFHQSRHDSRPSSRGFRVRPQYARRGGFRNVPVPPFAVHNPNNNVRNTQPSTTNTERPRPRPMARRSNIGVILNNRILASRDFIVRDYIAQIEPEVQRSLVFSTEPISRKGTKSSTARLKKYEKMNHGESLLTLLLRLHSKYCQKARSYEFNEARAEANRRLDRIRIGDGAHFVTIVLDLICISDQQTKDKLEYLQKLIWSDRKNSKEQDQQPCNKGENDKPIDIKTSSLSSSSNSCENKRSQPVYSSEASSASKTEVSNLRTQKDSSTSPTQSKYSNDKANFCVDSGISTSERRRRAKEYQSKLMAEFAKKQNAFIEKYEFTSSRQVAHVSGIASSISSKSSSSGSVAGVGGSSATPSSSAGAVAASLNSNDKANLSSVDSTILTSCHSPSDEPINLSSKSSSRDTSKPQPTRDYDKKQKQQLVGEGASIDKNSNNNKDQETLKASSSLSGDYLARDSFIKNEHLVGDDNDSNVIYECCICGVEGPSDLANPLGQVVLLQSTSIYGHSHLRPKSERCLPCDEFEYKKLKEETYAKYLERRIDLLCEHFSEISWLDSINIGAEGGVHVQSCGHYLHIECYQSYIKSLDQEDRLRGGTSNSSRNDSDEFLCPVCRQLANSVLPILNDMRKPGHLSLSVLSSKDLYHQIKLIGSHLKERLPPNQKELQSSAAFCSHLTKATGPQYRLVRSSASMHSLFLFLTSIARTNLETEIIVRLSDENAKMTATSNKPSSSTSTTTAQSMSSASTSAFSKLSSRRSCFQLLFNVLALNAQTLINDQWFTYDQIWSHLTQSFIDEKDRLSVKPMNSEVPLLLRDPTAMLLQFLFTITNSLCYKDNFTCIVKILFNLTVIQSIALVLSYVKPSFIFEESSSEGNKPNDDKMVINEEEMEQQSVKSRIESINTKFEDEKSGEDERTSTAYKFATNDFERLVVFVGLNLTQLLANPTTEPLMNSTVRNCWARFSCLEENDNNSSVAPSLDSNPRKQFELIENRVKLACLPFLRACSLIQYHLYNQDYPGMVNNNQIYNVDHRITDKKLIEVEFETLTNYLDLNNNNNNKTTTTTNHTSQDKDTFNCENESDSADTTLPRPDTISHLLNWPPAVSNSHTNAENFGERLIVSWSSELLHRFAREYSIAARTLLICRPLAWYRPSLMQLPRNFDDIFMHYYRKKCSLCLQIPKDVAVCLVCGASICFRVSCCKDRSRSRQDHSQHCGANTAVFLAIHTSTIVVIRGNRACVWGSVYLDAHDEEDNGLQRGKPLYLVEARYNLLERQWLTHSFDHTCSRKWVYLHDNQL